MVRAKFQEEKIPNYRIVQGVEFVSVGMTDFKLNPARFIRNAAKHPIKLLKYGRIIGLIISPNYYGKISIQLEDARRESANLQLLLATISPDLLKFWQANPRNFLVGEKPAAKIRPSRDPYGDAKEYVASVRDVLNDFEIDHNDVNFELDDNLGILINRWNQISQGRIPR